MINYRAHGSPPYRAALVHGGPGAAGEMASVAQELAIGRGILEPLQTAKSFEGQIDELRVTLERHATPPVILAGFSWGAWVSYVVTAQYPDLVRKLLLISSGPFDLRYVPQIEQHRMKRLSEQEQAEWHAIGAALYSETASDKNALLSRLGDLASKADAYDPIAGQPEAAILIDAEIYEGVWETAAEWRRSAKLIELGKEIRCPVLAIHGDSDPHPAEGVEQPLSAVLKDFRFVLLKNCGHRPWLERQARSPFFEVLERELLPD